MKVLINLQSIIILLDATIKNQLKVIFAMLKVKSLPYVSRFLRDFFTFSKPQHFMNILSRAGPEKL